MARKNVLKTYKMFNSEDISTSATSGVTNTSNLDKASIYLEWTGAAPVGTITVEATNDDPNSSSPVWKTVDFGSSIDISGASGNHDLIFNEMPFNAIRLQYTSTSGTGTLNATIHAKTQGA